jgi:hypothetical protein
MINAASVVEVFNTEILIPPTANAPLVHFSKPQSTELRMSAAEGKFAEGGIMNPK